MLVGLLKEGKYKHSVNLKVALYFKYTCEKEAPLLNKNRKRPGYISRTVVNVAKERSLHKKVSRKYQEKVRSQELAN